MLNEPPELRRPDGEPVFTEHGAARYTSQAVLDAETAAGQRRQDADRGRAIRARRRPPSLDGFEARHGHVCSTPGSAAW